MKKLCLLLAVSLFIATVFSQSINKISMADNGSVEMISFEVESNIMLQITTDGNIIRWGYDVFKDRGGENYFGKLEDYVGRVEYYNENDNEAFRGKVKSIGRTNITWYASYDGDAFKGKLKSIGSFQMAYYDNYEDQAFRGKLKSVGNYSFAWYASYNNEAYRGKLKNVGSTQFSYYSSTDDKAFAGKIKTLDGTTFTFYSSYDLPEYRGRMKTGTQILISNGIKYFVRN